MTTTSKPTSTTTAPPADPASQAIAAYQKSWDLTFAATNPPNINYPGLSDVLTGTALDEALTLINRLLRTGGRLEGKVTAHAKPLSAAADKVVLDECAVEVSNEYDASGAVVNADDGSTGTHFTVTVVNEGGNWKVSLFERPDENPCAP